MSKIQYLKALFIPIILFHFCKDELILVKRSNSSSKYEYQYPFRNRINILKIKTIKKVYLLKIVSIRSINKTN